MRRPVLMTAMGVLLAPAAGQADSHTVTVSTGYNETALISPFNRSTAIQSRLLKGRQLYLGSADSHGQVSVGFGWVASALDFERHTNRYPALTVFARPGDGSGVALTFHEEWHWAARPSRSPGKYLTLFQTEGGVVWQDGHAPKVRVTQRFVTSERRHPARSQGVEWVWEFRQDFPSAVHTVTDRGRMMELERQTMRFENWAFFSRELGRGVLRLNIGATYKTVNRSDTAEPAREESIGQVLERAGSGFSRVPVVMARVAYEVRRW